MYAFQPHTNIDPKTERVVAVCIMRWSLLWYSRLHLDALVSAPCETSRSFLDFSRCIIRLLTPIYTSMPARI